jgi:hypothetical protein
MFLVKRKKRIRVAFFLIHSSIWKYDEIYRLMHKNEKFDPVIVICPYASYGETTMFYEMDKAYNLFVQKGYNVVKTYSTSTGLWLNVKKEIMPDVIFFTNPHDISRREYHITNYLTTLTCYAPYAFVVIHLLSMHYSQLFHSLLWKAFYETPSHFEYARKLSINKGRNVYVSGYPGIDKFVNNNYSPSSPWKKTNKEVKKIIWAPHHTIEGEGGNLDYSNFMKYSSFMKNVAEKYCDRIQICFKPHPMLKPKLSKTTIWGPEKTDKYYSSWNELPNGLLNESDYIDLFLTSDALIHDSASFMVEYMYTGKPIAFTTHDAQIRCRFNDFGKIVFDFHYHLDSESAIISFIEETVLNEKDTMLTKRALFVKENLMPPNNRTASENIYNEIVRILS